MNLSFVSTAQAANSAEIDRETVYKGLLGIGLIVLGVKLLTNSSAKAGSAENITEEYGDKDVRWLAKAVHGEARGEPFKGQVAVAAVIVNRVQSEFFPDTVYDVVFQEKQFTSVADGQIYLEANQTAYRAAREALAGNDPSQGALYFYNPATARYQSWFQTREVTVKIGNHVFAR
jgi:N-acetylmuramoyl-L-alanine amidase